jgi:tRNA pseudouridine32 synthase / 23S rRNA pseudouridine746 synthase
VEQLRGLTKAATIDMMRKQSLLFCFLIETAATFSPGRGVAQTCRRSFHSAAQHRRNHDAHEDEPSKPPPSTTTATTTTMVPMVQNPITKRNIQLGGPTYKELLKEGGWVQHEGTLKRLDLAALRTYQLATKNHLNDNHQDQQETLSYDSNEDGCSRGPEKWYCITPVVVVLEDETKLASSSSSFTTPQRRRNLSPEEVKLLQEQLLFVHKPSGMNCVPSRDDLLSVAPSEDKSSSSSSLASQISTYFGETAKPCHRLDRDTSGIVVFGRTPESHRDLSKQFEQRTTTKSYTALLAGCPPDAASTSSSLGQVVDLPIGKVPTKEGFNRWAIGGDKPRQAITHWRVEKTFTIQGAMYSKVMLEPKTGRGHQLRLHMKALGCPILGDTIHGNNENENENNNPIGTGVAMCAPRLCLHAQTLQVDWNGLRLEAESVSPF